MKHIIHFVEKYDDVAAALRTTLLAFNCYWTNLRISTSNNVVAIKQFLRPN